jgi:hypothetical protein
LQKYGKGNWKKIQQLVRCCSHSFYLLLLTLIKLQVNTRNLTQIRSHAQKFFKKAERDQQKQNAIEQKTHRAMMTRRAPAPAGLGFATTPVVSPCTAAAAHENIAACMLLLCSKKVEGTQPAPLSMLANQKQF